MSARTDRSHHCAIAAVRMLTRYKAWANEITFGAVMALPEGEALRPRPTRFGNIVHSLNHVYVVDDIFRSHLEGRPHGYTARNTEHTPPVSDLWEAVQIMDLWYVSYADQLNARALGETVHFEFVGGGPGALTREQILLHIVNHGTYHRGFVGDMLYQVPAAPPANDLPVFLRDVYNGLAVGGPQAHRLRPRQSVAEGDRTQLLRCEEVSLSAERVNALAGPCEPKT